MNSLQDKNQSNEVLNITYEELHFSKTWSINDFNLTFIDRIIMELIQKE
jgi:hypothetical protein